MSWETRAKNGRKYYYRAVRRNGRTFKQYFGNGPKAHAAARNDRIERADREADRQRLQLLESSLWPLNRRMQIQRQCCGLIYHGVHLASGFKLTRSYNWRRRTDWKMESMTTATGVSTDRQYRTLGDVVELIKRGRTDLIGELRRALQSSPELDKMEDIARQTQRAWAGLLSRGDILRREVFLLQADKLRSELVGNDASAGERLMAERVVTLQQQVCYYDQLEAANAVEFAGSRTGQAISARQEKANRQLTAAIQQLGVIQKLQAEYIPRKPAIALRLFRPDQERKTA